MEKLRLGDVVIEVEKKNIKNIYLRVYPPSGRVRISAPLQVDMDTVRGFARSKLQWIKRQQAKFQSQDSEASGEFPAREGHYYKGQPYLLKVMEVDAVPKIELTPDALILYVRPDTPMEKRQAILEEWYRTQMKMILPAIIEKWEAKLNVKVKQFGIKKMKSKWGSCNIRAQRIWLNLELIKKPPECLEYVVVHEMVHLLERNHNKRFYAIMDQCLPQWRLFKDELNRLPIRPY
jgi:predicted metal-dependent hydrolase